jgi:hypothetical protein
VGAGRVADGARRVGERPVGQGDEHHPLEPGSGGAADGEVGGGLCRAGGGAVDGQLRVLLPGRGQDPAHGDGLGGDLHRGEACLKTRGEDLVGRLRSGRLLAGQLGEPGGVGRRQGGDEVAARRHQRRHRCQPRRVGHEPGAVGHEYHVEPALRQLVERGCQELDRGVPDLGLGARHRFRVQVHRHHLRGAPLGEGQGRGAAGGGQGTEFQGAAAGEEWLDEAVASDEVASSVRREEAHPRRC